MRYPLLFPNDITYTVGKSDYHKDWFFEEVPHATTGLVNPAAKDPANQRFGWVKLHGDRTGHVAHIGPGPGDHLDHQIQHGQGRRKARRPCAIALGGADGGGGWPSASTASLWASSSPSPPTPCATTPTGASGANMSQTFDAALLKAGENEMTLTVPAGDLTSGVCYDYLRLELDEN